jgi:hypothetical protein
MIVVICGQHRSGSTLAWQIVHELLSRTRSVSSPLRTPASRLRLHALRPRHVRMVKLHYSPALSKNQFPQRGAQYIYTFRDPRDVAASLIRKGRYSPEHQKRGPEAVTAMIRRELRGDAFWRTRESLWIGRYEDITQDISALVHSLAAFLQVSADDETVALISEHVSVERQRERVAEVRSGGIDPSLRITSNHITDGQEGAWRATLTPDEVAAIEDVAGDWMRAHGYSCEPPPR